MRKAVLGRIPPVRGARQLPEGDSGCACYPVDDVHQARITQGVGDGGWHLERIKEKSVDDEGRRMHVSARACGDKSSSY